MAKTDAIQSCKIFRIGGICTGLAVVVLVKGTAVVVVTDAGLVVGIIFDDVVALDDAGAAVAGLVDVTTVVGWLVLEVVELFMVPDTTFWIQLR